MNYYSFHIGDYAAHTRHLTLLEDLAYRRLLDLYYLREGVLPESCARLIGMADHAEAVEAVLRDFFEPAEGGWRHKRCDEELAKYHAMAEGGKRGSAKRWGKTDEVAIAPPSAGDSPPIAPLSLGNGEAKHPPSTPQCQPITNNQEPITKRNTTHRSARVDRPAEVSQPIWDSFLQHRKAKRAPVTDAALRGIRKEADKAGMPLEEVLETCCSRGWAGFQAEWVKASAKPSVWEGSL